MSSARHDAFKAVTNYKSNGQALNFKKTPSAALFASNVFNDKIMKDRLPKSVYKRSITTAAAIWWPRRSISRTTSLGRCKPYATSPTSWKESWPTTCGLCRRIARSCSPSSRGAVPSALNQPWSDANAVWPGLVFCARGPKRSLGSTFRGRQLHAAVDCL